MIRVVLVRSVAVWCGEARSGMVWCGMVRFGAVRFILIEGG